jgi:hypothetical protein
MTCHKHSVASDDSPPLKFLIDRHWWIFRSFYTDEQGRVQQVEGQWSEGHHVHATFDLSAVRNSTEIAHTVRLFETFRNAQNEDDQLYVSGFSAGHKPGCPSAIPEIRDSPVLKEMGGAPCKCGKVLNEQVR